MFPTKILNCTSSVVSQLSSLNFNATEEFTRSPIFYNAVSVYSFPIQLSSAKDLVRSSNGLHSSDSCSAVPLCVKCGGMHASPKSKLLQPSGDPYPHSQFCITRRQTTHDENELHFLSRRMPLLPRNKRISTKKSETLTLVATEARFTRITMAPPLTTKTLFPTIRVRVLCPVVSHIPAFIAIKSKDHSEK